MSPHRCLLRAYLSTCQFNCNPLHINCQWIASTFSADSSGAPSLWRTWSHPIIGARLPSLTPFPFYKSRGNSAEEHLFSIVLRSKITVSHSDTHTQNTHGHITTHLVYLSINNFSNKNYSMILIRYVCPKWRYFIPKLIFHSYFILFILTLSTNVL